MRHIKSLILVVAVILLWGTTVALLQPDAYLFPSPLDVATSYVSNFSLLVEHSSITLAEVLVGFSVANVLAVGIAMILVFVPSFERVTLNLAVALKTIPIVALAPLLVLWFGSGIWSKIVIVVLVCFFPALVNVLRGVKSLDEDHYDLFRVYGASKRKIVKYFLLPGILPYLLSALKVSSTLAVIGALVGEFVSANRGLGFLIITNYYSMNTSMVFACLIITSAMGLLLYGAINHLEGKLTPGLKIQ